MKEHETLPSNPPIHIFINRINNRLVFTIKDGYKLELQLSETTKLSGSTKIMIDKTKNGENVPSLEVVEVFLVQCLLFIFASNKFYVYLLNAEPSNLVCMFLSCYVRVSE